MERRRLFIMVFMLILGTGVFLSTSVFSGKKTVAVEKVENVADPEPETDVSETSAPEEKTYPVYICGEVNHPGVYEVTGQAYLYELIGRAGGMTQAADTVNIDMVYIIDTSQSIYIPAKSESENGMLSVGEEKWTPKAGTGTSSVRRVNINKAGSDILTTLPGIGEKTAEKIVSYREEHGPFQSIEEIKNVPGIGESKYEMIKTEICV